jgi:dipeptidase E
MTDEADIIYVGGGNTKLMLDTWRVTGFDAVLSRAWKAGKVLAGVSAGAMCWFTRGFSDYDSFGNNDEWQFKPIDCLDFTPGLFCPHLDSEHRMLPLIRHILDSADEAYAGMDGTALVVDGEDRRAIRVRESAHMYHLRPSREGVHVTEMPATTLG